MRFKRGKDRYSLPRDFIGFHQVFVHVGKHMTHIQQTHCYEIERLKMKNGEVLGIPTSFALASNGCQMEVWPVPDKAYRGTIEITTIRRL